MSEIAKIKVAEVEFNREFKPQGKSFTIYYFNLKTTDEQVGEFSTSTRNQTKFLVGEEYEVDISEKSNRGGIYNWFDYSEGEKEKRKTGTGGGSHIAKKGWQPYVRPRKEIMSIVSQSSYEAAVQASVKLVAILAKQDKVLPVDSHTQIKDIARMFATFIAESSGLNSPECKTAVPDNLKDANQKSIVYQAALKRAIDMLDLPLVATQTVCSTQGIITLTEAIVKDINEIANGL
jgi:hypothetical protein